MEVWKMIFLFNLVNFGVFFRFHANFQGYRWMVWYNHTRPGEPSFRTVGTCMDTCHQVIKCSIWLKHQELQWMDPYHFITLQNDISHEHRIILITITYIILHIIEVIIVFVVIIIIIIIIIILIVILIVIVIVFVIVIVIVIVMVIVIVIVIVLSSP